MVSLCYMSYKIYRQYIKNKIDVDNLDMSLYYIEPINLEIYNIIKHGGAKDGRWLGIGIAQEIICYLYGHNDFCDHPHYVTTSKGKTYNIKKLEIITCNYLKNKT